MTDAKDGTPRWLSADELRAWLAFIAVVELLPGQLDVQLQRDAGDTHFEYMTMAMLSDAPDHTLRMTALAVKTQSTLPRLSHVVTRLVNRGYLLRLPCPEDKRATNVRLTERGWEHLQASAPVMSRPFAGWSSTRSGPNRSPNYWTFRAPSSTNSNNSETSKRPV